ncbi:MAG TPA: phosphoribosylglycinamide formyltransferase [Bacteroidales bacterium]|nr:phosphoribosylglycinamide formyltransferase [Bacteroidales bacterium]
MNNLAIFASGSGTNAENLIRFFRTSKKNNITLVLSNKENAGVLKRAENLDIPTVVIDRQEFYDSDHVLKLLNQYDINYIVLAGFLWLVPENLVKNYPSAIVNIHPALLPKYGGKGMYGSRVHEAVIANGERESGITIHYVNEKYDEGNIIFQATCPVEKGETPKSLAQKVHELEYKHFPNVLEELLDEKTS